MTAEIATNDLRAETMEKVLIGGDLAKLTPAERLSYYNSVCQSVGLNPLTNPFEYIVLNGKMRLYAKREATDQLRKNQGISIKIVGREKIGNVYVVTAQASDAKGRFDESTGAVVIGHLQGDALANALMKAETKAKRRVTLSICGLGMMDESEIESVPGAKPVERPHVPTPQLEGNSNGPSTEAIASCVESLKSAESKDMLVAAWETLPRQIQKNPEVQAAKEEAKLRLLRVEMHQLLVDLDMPMVELNKLAKSKGCDNIDNMGTATAQDIVDELKRKQFELAGSGT